MVTEGPLYVDACERCNLVCDRRLFSARAGKMDETDLCICGGKLIRKPLNEWLSGAAPKGEGTTLHALGWKSLIVDAAAQGGAQLDRLAKHLEQVDVARQMLRDMGYGVTGTPIIEQVKAIAEASA